jgi:hypothetical protein
MYVKIQNCIMSAAEKTRTSRTLAERAEAIFNFINAQPGPFPKSDLQQIGFSPKTAGNWIQLIEYIQSQPRIRVRKMGASTYIEKIENKYLLMLRERILDSSLTLKERSETMNYYIAALITLERMEMGRIEM